jgi:hypothetical protein
MAEGNQAAHISRPFVHETRPQCLYPQRPEHATMAAMSELTNQIERLQRRVEKIMVRL